MSDPIIELSGVSKTYGSGAGAAIAVDGVDMEIARGEFVSLMGPSGSGKTTLLNLVAGLDEPDGGRVVVDGRELRALTDHQRAAMRLRSIGFVFQAFNLLPALSIERNVAWPLRFSGYSRVEAGRRAAAALDRVGVANYEGRYPAELSGGEQQRVAIARAVATGPSILLADEPTGNLDSRTGETILDLLRELNHSQGATVVMVTHNIFAASYGDRTLELRDGRIIRDVRTPRRDLKLAAAGIED